jgi:hypothetical protein
MLQSDQRLGTDISGRTDVGLGIPSTARLAIQNNHLVQLPASSSLSSTTLQSGDANGSISPSSSSSSNTSDQQPQPQTGNGGNSSVWDQQQQTQQQQQQAPQWMNKSTTTPNSPGGGGANRSSRYQSPQNWARNRGTFGAARNPYTSM